MGVAGGAVGGGQAVAGEEEAVAADAEAPAGLGAGAVVGDVAFHPVGDVGLAAGGDLLVALRVDAESGGVVGAAAPAEFAVPGVVDDLAGAAPVPAGLAL